MPLIENTRGPIINGMKLKSSNFLGWRVEMLLVGDDIAWECDIMSCINEFDNIFYVCRVDDMEMYVAVGDICWLRKMKKLEDAPRAKIFPFTKSKNKINVVK